MLVYTQNMVIVWCATARRKWCFGPEGLEIICRWEELFQLLVITAVALILESYFFCCCLLIIIDSSCSRYLKNSLKLFFFHNTVFIHFY